MNAGREAQLRLAVYNAFDAKDGDPDEYRRRLEHVVDLHERLWAEEIAELGHLPATVEGCIGVLHAAARIIETIGQDSIEMESGERRSAA